MQQKFKIGDAVWCSTKKGNQYGFVVDRIEYEGGRDVLYGYICGEEIYATSEACQKLDLPTRELI